MTREQVFELMMETGVVAIIRAQSSDQLKEVIRALKDGGMKAIEVTMTTPNALEVIRDSAREFAGKDVAIGVGSVLDPETARAAILAGAEFVVCPTLNLEVIKVCRRYSKVVMPGAFTPTEILQAWEAGADVVKVFPASTLGPRYIKDIKGPLPQVALSPTGGVDLDNAGAFIKAGASCVAVGSSLVSKDLLTSEDWPALTERAREFLSVVRKARSS
ncbi:MAG: bifunctional 4-hydroxy-2-oxoglutarate aldolase/2-dehydro-3-deoxy-phosphogluconate aldolase [Firmicutes bacterium]|nr:bifunctional 4-hydroxy-2-oxoglutarate aldolase/2-dehydro-3-deoxy-phosphogluconate aldolase [Bacillota bacterium]